MSFLAIYLTTSLVILILINSTSAILNRAAPAALKVTSTSESGYGCALMLLLSLILISPYFGIAIYGLESVYPIYGIGLSPQKTINLITGSENRFSILIESLLLILTMAIVQIVKPSRLKESALLITFSTLGLILMIETSNLIGLYLAVELYSLSAYILASGAEGVYFSSLAYGSSTKEPSEANKSSISAGLKYFVLSALSSGVLVVGISLVYGVTGELSLNGLSRALSMYSSPTIESDALSFNGMWSANLPQSESLLLITGTGLILSTLLFKIGAAPFHFWVPDVYSKVSLFVNFYMISVPKVGILFTLIKISFIWPSSLAYTSLLLGFSILSLIVGAVGGLVQIKTARLLAYSSINHVGYILLALYAAHIPFSMAEDLNAYSGPSPLHIYGIGLYLLVYCFMTVNMFTVLYTLKFYRENLSTASHTDIRGDFISGLKGLSALNPFLAASMAITLLSMAGVPPLAGFVAKLTVYMGVLDSGALAPAVFAVLCSVVSAVYYLRLIKVAYFYKTVPTSTRSKKSTLKLSSFSSNLISLCTLLIVFFPIIKPSFIFLYLN